MKKIMFSTMFLFIVNIAIAQEKSTLKVTNKTDLNQVFAGRYLFPEFQNARVYLKTATSDVRMNYNILLDRMLFIDAQGDTLGLKNVNDLVLIIFNQQYSFKYTTKGYMEVLAVVPSEGIELMLKRSFQVADGKKYGPYGVASTTFAIDNIDNLETGVKITTGSTNRKTMSVSQEVTVRQLSAFYLNNVGKLYTANRSGFLKVFPKQKKEIENYLKTNPVNFNEAADLMRLFEYCKSLLTSN